MLLNFVNCVIYISKILGMAGFSKLAAFIKEQAVNSWILSAIIANSLKSCYRAATINCVLIRSLPNHKDFSNNSPTEIPTRARMRASNWDGRWSPNSSPYNNIQIFADSLSECDSISSFSFKIPNMNYLWVEKQLYRWQMWEYLHQVLPQHGWILSFNL